MPRECTESNSFRGKTLEFCSLNIHGLQSRQLGSKLLDPEFLKIIKNVDFLGLTETHTHDEILEDLNIPGFIRISYKNRKKNLKSGTSSGGLPYLRKCPLQTCLVQ